MKRIARHLTFANVVACLALFVALGGASYAAFRLPKESVDTEALHKGAVTPAKLSDKARQGMAGARGPKGATGAAGPQGAAGSPGPAGEPGPSAAYSYFHEAEVIVAQTTSTQAGALSVPPGSYVVQAEVAATSLDNPADAMECALHAGEESTAAAILGTQPGNSIDQELSMQLAHTFPGPGQITITCRHPFTAGALNVSNIRIIAIKVGEIAANINS
jgi:hypothetical protein